MHTGKQNSVKYIVITLDHKGRRIDNYLFGVLKGVPKTRIYQMLRRGEVRIDGRRIKQDYRLLPGDNLRLPPVYLPEKDKTPTWDSKLLERIKNSIIYENKNLIVLNKPSGIVVHSGTGQSYGVIEAIRMLFNDTENNFQLVHRLDKDTSGILMVAKNMPYLTYLHNKLKTKQIRKTYKALLCGRLAQRTVKVDLPLTRNILKSGERLANISQQGKAAESTFHVEKKLKKMTFVKIGITTGRTHQIRVHAAALGHPVAGDIKYGDKAMNKDLRKAGLKRLFLHASHIRVPGNQEYPQLDVSAPLPVDLSSFLDLIERNAK